MIAIGRIEPFEGGWAVLSANPTCAKAHFWHQPEPITNSAGSGVFWKSLCGVRGATSETWPALDQGTFPKCKRCEGFAR